MEASEEVTASSVKVSWGGILMAEKKRKGFLTKDWKTSGSAQV
jgi:hypothetical protein